MISGNQPYQPLSPQDASYSDDAVVSPSATCSYFSSSSSSLATPEPEDNDQKPRINIIEHMVSQPKSKSKPKKQYQCPQCLKSFSRPSALQTHSYTHTAEKPFQCRNFNCGRSFSVVSNLRRHFKVHQKAAVGDKLSAEDRLRCVRNLMERSSKILANKRQILPYSTVASHFYPAAYHEHRRTSYPTLPLPVPQQQQTLPPPHQYYYTLPDLNMNNEKFMMQGPHQSMLLPLAYPTATDSKVPIPWVNQFGAPTPCTPSTNSGAFSYGPDGQN